MGMSNDYLIAVEEGATFVRIGTETCRRRGVSHLALKDLFSGFFVIDDEEEVEVPDKQQQVNEAPAKEQSQQTTKQNAIKSVPQKSASRYTTTSEERNNRMSELFKK